VAPHYVLQMCSDHCYNVIFIFVGLPVAEKFYTSTLDRTKTEVRRELACACPRALVVTP